jgi:hypothetical protein
MTLLEFRREGQSRVHIDESDLQGVPILYIPGNAGSGKQVRSMGAQAALDYDSLLRNLNRGLESEPSRLNFFAVDFADELTAMSGPALASQIRFVNRCVQHILDLARRAAARPGGHRWAAPQSVVLIGHSMGGVVARGVTALPSFLAGTVQTIITLSAPHAALPAYADPGTRSQLRAINAFWREALILYPRRNTSTAADRPWRSSPSWAEEARRRLRGVVLVSLGGGRRDFLVPTDMCNVRAFCPPANG